MDRMVAYWRCNCGTHLKVVAESVSSQPAKQIVSCPKCRNTRAINADKIISVTENTSDASHVAISCEEKERLLVSQKQAFDIYMRGVSELVEAVGTIAHAEFEFLANQVEAARQFFLKTRRQLNEHAAKHGC